MYLWPGIISIEAMPSPALYNSTAIGNTICSNISGEWNDRFHICKIIERQKSDCCHPLIVLPVLYWKSPPLLC